MHLYFFFDASPDTETVETKNASARMSRPRGFRSLFSSVSGDRTLFQAECTSLRTQRLKQVPIVVKDLIDVIVSSSGPEDWIWVRLDRGVFSCAVFVTSEPNVEKPFEVAAGSCGVTRVRVETTQKKARAKLHRLDLICIDL